MSIAITGDKIETLVDCLAAITHSPREAYYLLIATIVYLSENKEFLREGSDHWSREELCKNITENILKMETFDTSNPQ